MNADNKTIRTFCGGPPNGSHEKAGDTMPEMTTLSNNEMRNRLVVIALITLSIAFVPTLSPGVHSQTTIVLNTADILPDSSPDQTGIGDRVIKEAFKRIGVPLRIVRLPSERALINADEGIDDGNYARIKEIGEFCPNLVLVPESVLKFEFVIFTKRLRFKPAGWESLKPYNMGIVRGWKILEANITGTKSLIKAKNERILFGLLNSDRVDAIVYDRLQGLVLLRELKYRDIYLLRPPLVVRDMYLHLHKKHAALVPRLTDAMRGMKKDGTYNKIVRQVLNDYAE